MLAAPPESRAGDRISQKCMAASVNSPGAVVYGWHHFSLESRHRLAYVYVNFNQISC